MNDRTPSAFLASEFAPAPAERARFHVIPAPMECSVSYGAGTARGPAAILAASQQLEALDRGRTPGALGIFTAPAARPPRARAADAEAWLAAIERAVARALACGAMPLVLGGEHTVTLGAARAFLRAGRRVGFVQFDAHADLRDRYEGTPLSHACVMRRVHELGFPVAQFATRAYCAEEAGYRRRHGLAAFDADALHRGRRAVRLPPGFPRDLYVTFDVDALEPAAMPATGTPVPGGIDWHQAMDLLEALARGRRVAGADVVELAPRPLHVHADFAAALLAYRLMGLAAAAPRQR